MSVLRFLLQLLKLSPTGLASVLVASLFVNVLYLIGPIYMMHIYDSVIGASSLVNLVAVSVIAGFLYLVFFGFDALRARLLVLLAPSIERSFGVITRRLVEKNSMDGATFVSVVRALDRLQQFVSTPAIVAFFDLPFTPLFIGIAFLIHPVIGLVGIIGSVILLATTIAFGRKSDANLGAFEERKRLEGEFGRTVLAQHEFVKTTHARGYILSKWGSQRDATQNLQYQIAATNAFSLSVTKTLRLVLQSAVLGVGAWLVLKQNLSPGAIIAASVVVSRALMPMEQAVAARRALQSAMSAMQTLNEVESVQADQTQLPTNESHDLLTGADIVVQNLKFSFPDTPAPILRDISFSAAQGVCLAVTGPNGCGKTTLLRCIMGSLVPQGGKVSIGGVVVGPGVMERLAHEIRYLPQQTNLFPFSIAQNIALADTREAREIAQAAARLVGCHEAISSLEAGYDTIPFNDQGGMLSPGLVQSIALARTIAGNARIVIFDEPVRSLDAASVAQFTRVVSALQERGTTLIMVTHDPRIISLSEMVLIFHPIAGPLFGPTKEILSRLQAIEGQRDQRAQSMGPSS